MNNDIEQRLSLVVDAIESGTIEKLRRGAVSGQHATNADLVAIQLGKISQREREELRHHIILCPGCRGRLQLTRRELKEASSRRRGFAAGVVLLAAAIVILLFWMRSSEHKNGPVANPTAPVQNGAPANVDSGPAAPPPTPASSSANHQTSAAGTETGPSSNPPILPVPTIAISTPHPSTTTKTALGTAGDD